jgi:NDP-sugar pyrophosphorylase family protein
MKALILDSGMGKRLRPLTERTPEALLMVGDNTILGHQLDNLLSCEIRDVIITTGPFENKIKSYVKERYPNVSISYVRNPRYCTTNYIYSMWLTRELIDDDIILFHGDLLFEKNC